MRLFTRHRDSRLVQCDAISCKNPDFQLAPSPKPAPDRRSRQVCTFPSPPSNIATPQSQPILQRPPVSLPPLLPQILFSLLFPPPTVSPELIHPPVARSHARIQPVSPRSEFNYRPSASVFHTFRSKATAQINPSTGFLSQLGHPGNHFASAADQLKGREGGRRSVHRPPPTTATQDGPAIWVQRRLGYVLGGVGGGWS
jgi:hypothetical protein